MTNAEVGEFIQEIKDDGYIEDDLIVWYGETREKLVAIMREAFRLQDEEEGNERNNG